jgi:FixJ family two-component response regulator/formylmethanofuran dehydrogenase subunit D
MLEGRRIVLVEDDEIMGASLVQRLTLEGAEVQWHRQIARALPAIRTPRKSLDAVICDIRLPDGTGEELYDTLTRTSHPPPFLFITGQGGIDQAVRLIRSGAADYIAKPFDIAAFLTRLATVMRPRADQEMPPETGITAAARMVDRQIAETAARDTPLLIRGAQGLGKLRLARRVHDLSERRAAPILIYNALRDRVGAAEVEAAVDEVGEGTLVVVGIGELDPSAQDRVMAALRVPNFRLKGYFRPSDAHVGRPAPYIDQLIIAGGGKVHHIWANDHYKTTLNAAEFKRVYNRRTNMVKEAMDARAGATREELVDAIVGAINAGGIFSVNVDIIHSQIGQAAHVILPAVESGEMNLTSMNGERRLRLVEKYMDAPGSAQPDCIIAARLANHMERVLRDEGRADYADQFKGFDWKTEEDSFMDGYNTGNPEVTYDRLRAAGNNGVQEPVKGYENGALVGTMRLYEDGVFTRHGREDGKALFCMGSWRGLQAPGKAQQQANHRFLINNGRANLNWQNWFLDQKNDFVMDRLPVPFIQIHPDDMAELGLKPGDMVEVFNDVGATQALAYPEPTARKNETFMVFGAPNGAQGNVINAGTNELILPNYKQTWANIRKISDATPAAARVSYKSWEVEL